MYFTTYSSPIGLLTLVGDEKYLTGLWIEGQKYFQSTVQGSLVKKDDLPLLIQAKEWLNRYFQGERPGITELTLCPSGSLFRQNVWKLLCEIPYGEVTTYKAISKKLAAQMGKAQMSAQAVGGAVGHNPISIIIPCHRVVGVNGSLTGYAGGIETKIKLLRHEGADLSHLWIPNSTK